MNDIWDQLQRDPPESVSCRGMLLRRGARVRVSPKARGDVFDAALAGRVGIVEALEQSFEGVVQAAITFEDDPGRDMGEGRYPGHRFFFALDELEPLDTSGDEHAPANPSARSSRVLVAGIGNIFLGDDGFGVAVAQQLATRTLPSEVHVRDFGIRGMDLAYALQNDYDAVIFVDATPRGEPPGTLFVIDARVDADTVRGIDTHGMDPVRVLALARSLGRVPARVLVLGCEPSAVLGSEPWADMDMSLSEPVHGAIGEAVTLAESLIAETLAELRATSAASDSRTTSNT